MTTSECRSKFQSGGSPTETQNGNPADDIRMMQNPAYATTERWNRFESISPTESHYVNGAEDVPMMENPAYVTHSYTEIHHSLTRPRPAPMASYSHPNVYNTMDSTSDHEYI